MKWKEPTLLERFNPERTIVVLPIELEEQNGGKSSEKKLDSGKSSEKIMNLIKDNPKITIEEISGLLNITTRAVEKNLLKLKTKGSIVRKGPDKGGFWKIKSI